MSLVVFPFKAEHPDVVLTNITVAATHPRVHCVLAMGYEEDDTYRSIAAAAPEIARRTGTEVVLRLQQRVGNKRPGKGDAMNSALRYFLQETELPRIHFYDADITSFGADWISKAEEAADLDYGVVRHYFPRASTDGLITWFVTRVGFALLWPDSELSWIEQPLGGELLFRRDVAETLVADERVQAQSDWGIDTLYTFVTVQLGIPMYESYIARGKAHKVYGRLSDLRTMLVECFGAVQALAGEQMPRFDVHRTEYPDVVPHEIAERIAFDVEGTLQLLREGWTDRQVKLLEHFPDAIAEPLLACRSYPRFAFLDDGAWRQAFGVLLEQFVPGDEDWAELLFRLWTVRVLHYTTAVAVRGYSYALRHLHAMIRSYRQQPLAPPAAS